MPRVHHPGRRPAGLRLPTTAKRALKEPDKLTPDTLARVQQAIAQLHYEPDQRAGSLRGGQSTTVGLVVGSILEPFFAQFARTASHVLADAGYTLIISENEYSAQRELQELRRLYGLRVAGILLRPGYGQDSQEYLARLRSRGVAVTEYDYRPPHHDEPSVMLDNPGAVRQAVTHLHALGHRRIAALGTYHPVIHPEERSRAFPEVMNALGLTVPAEYQRVTLLTEDTAYALTNDLLDLPEPPTALIALTGTQASGAYRAARTRGAPAARHQPRGLRQLPLDQSRGPAHHGAGAAGRGDGRTGRRADARAARTRHGHAAARGAGRPAD